MKLPTEALASIESALRVRPNYPAAELNRGVALQSLGRHQEAETAYRAALALRPNYVQALCNLGNLLRITGSWSEARAACEQAIALQPNHADAHANLANVLQNTGEHDAAMAAYARALELNPGHVNAQWNRGLTLLRAGDYAQGWRAYESRKRLSTPVAVRPYARPEWTGAEPLDGKTIFLHWEQGLGDTLQFCRYAKLLAARGAEVVLSAPDPLVRLLRSLGVSVIGTHAVPTRFDFHAPLMSLPAAFGTTLATIPAEPYLRADPAPWRARLAALPGRRIGLVWAGAARPEDPDSNAIDARRSMRLADFAPLAAIQGVSFVSIQKGPPGAQPPPAGMTLHDWTAELTDFADTAALVAGLDLVISVDTSTAHLAGALGKPVWILNRFDHCWRWLDGQGASPWYPSARLFRQTTPGDWSGVVARVAAAL